MSDKPPVMLEFADQNLPEWAKREMRKIEQQERIEENTYKTLNSAEDKQHANSKDSDRA